MQPNVALVVPDLSLGSGGVPTLVRFLHGVLERSGRYSTDIFSIATSASDSASVRLRAPASWRRGVETTEGEWEGIRYTHVGALGAELEFQRYRPRRVLRELLKDYDLIQVVAGAPPWALAGLDAGPPVLLWTASTLVSDRATRLGSGQLARRTWLRVMTALGQRMERRALQAVDTTFALSEYTLSCLRTLTSRHDSLMLAPCGVDTDHFRPAGVPDQGYILSVARFSDLRKNVRLLFEAYARLLHSAVPVPDLFLVGEPPSPEAQEVLRELRIADRVRLLGVRPADELARVYRNAAFFVLSSDEEGLGIPLLEAMASGVAVVSTACGGPETAIRDGDNGFLTPVGDVGSLAEAMRRLVEDPEQRRRMGKRGRELAVQRFSLDATGEVFLTRYDELMGIRPATVCCGHNT